MGCGACIGDKIVSVPVGHASALETALFWNIKKDLRPSKFIPQPQFTQIIKQLQYSALSQGNQKSVNLSEPQEGQLLVLTDIQKLKSKWKLLVLCSDEDLYQPQQYYSINLGLNHKCFVQIEKDLDRTFPQQKFFQTHQGISIFQRILKRIALYFPVTGYTQGINFIVGYLLVQQFSQQQTFWMVIHMAMSPKFLLLGFFQNGFPMATIFCKFFNHIIKTNLLKIYNHFELLGVAGQAWMFKWFMTYYLYSFPLQIAKQIWTLVMLKGSIGLIYFGFALLKQVQKQLLQFEEATQVIGFFQSLKDIISTFNSLIDLKSLLERAYSIEISKEQLQNISKINISESVIRNVYWQYYANSTNNFKQKQIIQRWHLKLKLERVQFRTKNKQQLIKQKGLLIPPQNNYNYLKNNKPPKQSKFRVKQQDFKKTKQKFMDKNLIKVTSNAQKDNESIVRSKISSKNSKTSHVIQISSISHNLKISNHSSLSQEPSHISRIQSQQSFAFDQPQDTRRQLTQQQISDGELTARVNASAHVINKLQKSTNEKLQQTQILQLHQPFKKKKQSGNTTVVRNQSLRPYQQIIKIPQSMENLSKKQSHKTIIQVYPTNIILRQQTLFSIDGSIDFDVSNGMGQSLDFRYKTPQTIKSYQHSLQKS